MLGPCAKLKQLALSTTGRSAPPKLGAFDGVLVSFRIQQERNGALYLHPSRSRKEGGETAIRVATLTGTLHQPKLEALETDSATARYSRIRINPSRGELANSIDFWSRWLYDVVPILPSASCYLRRGMAGSIAPWRRTRQYR